MEVRPNPTADNASIPQPHHRHAVAAPPKQAANSPIPVDTSSVSQRLQKELMSLMPPTSCNYNMATAVAQDPDCYHWMEQCARLVVLQVCFLQGRGA
ncbi:hypothetical protein RGQ29_028797 [Quercus rubra]|uniref:Uncharacterized protein n=1 Tax=Quercus rubra TaxID=3512 RepID=A0AAN7ETC2_QUERU|nr:hypothetical protein RGQ29_028797 [Quercus rubra]